MKWGLVFLVIPVVAGCTEPEKDAATNPMPMPERWIMAIAVVNTLDRTFEVDYYEWCDGEAPDYGATIEARPGNTTRSEGHFDWDAPCELRVAAYEASGSGYGLECRARYRNDSAEPASALFTIKASRTVSLSIAIGADVARPQPCTYA